MSAYGKTVLRDLGVVLHVPGLLALVSLPLARLFSEGHAAWPGARTPATEESSLRVFCKPRNGRPLTAIQSLTQVSTRERLFVLRR